MAAKRKVFGTTGDVNALDYGGGIVFDQGYGPEWWVWDSPEGETDEFGDYRVYRVNVPDDVFEEHTFADPFKIAKSIDVNPLKLTQLGSSRDVMDRVEALEEIAMHYGIASLDHDPETFTRAQMMRKFEPSFRAKRRR